MQVQGVAARSRAATRQRHRLSVAVLVALALVVLAAATLAACTSSRTGATGGYRFKSATKVGTTIPVADRKSAGNFTAPLLSGGEATLDSYRGKVVVLNFWASWCGPCTTETPQFDLVSRAYHAKGVQFLGVDTKDPVKNKGIAFFADNKISYPSVFDPDGAVSIKVGDLDPPGMPYTVLIDKQGKVAGVYIQPLTTKDLEPMLDTLVAQA